MSLTLIKLQDKAAEEAVAALNDLVGIEPEGAHSQADDALLQFIREAGFDEVSAAYDNLVAQSPWWGAG